METAIKAEAEGQHGKLFVSEGISDDAAISYVQQYIKAKNLSSNEGFNITEYNFDTYFLSPQEYEKEFPVRSQEVSASYNNKEKRLLFKVHERNGQARKGKERILFEILHEFGHIYHFNNGKYATRKASNLLFEGFAELFATHMVQQQNPEFEYSPSLNVPTINPTTSIDLSDIGEVVAMQYDLKENDGFVIYTGGWTLFDLISEVGFNRKVEIAMASRDNQDLIERICQELSIYDNSEDLEFKTDIANKIYEHEELHEEAKKILKINEILLFEELMRDENDGNSN